MTDAVVIGAGPNGLVAANVLADAGWSVLVLEANEQPGGAVRTAEVTAPGYRNDLFSAFYPLAAASPAIATLGLEQHGLRWVRAPLALAHPTPDGPAAVLSTDLAETARGLDRFHPGDGDAWRALYAKWQRASTPVLQSLLGPFPPMRAGLRLARAVGRHELLGLGRMAMMSVRRLGAEHFGGDGGALLLTGLAMHADLTPDAATGGLFGLLLAGIGQQIGFPVPEGGAQGLIDALVARLRAAGGEVVCGARVDRVVVRGGRAVAVRTADGVEHGAGRAVLADVHVVRLYRDLVGDENLPDAMLRALEQFDPGQGTFKVDWALSAPVPWLDADAARAGTVHLADSPEELATTATQIANGYIPERPFLLFGQMTTTDPTRSPPGTEAAWAYTHVPIATKGDAGGELKGLWDDAETAAFVERIEARIEAYAPGFCDRIAARHVFTPPALEAANANLVGGDVNGGTGQLHQQLVFRPVPGLARPETPVPGLFLASASAHPGGGVHGACGANAARAALLAARPGGRWVSGAIRRAANAIGS